MEGEIVCLIVRLSLHVQVMTVPACKRLGCLSHANGWRLGCHSACKGLGCPCQCKKMDNPISFMVGQPPPPRSSMVYMLLLLLINISLNISKFFIVREVNYEGRTIIYSLFSVHKWVLKPKRVDSNNLCLQENLWYVQQFVFNTHYLMSCIN